MVRKYTEQDLSHRSGIKYRAALQQDYMDEPNHHGIYDVNTIANYSPEIIPLLDTPAPCAFARDDSGKLVQVPYESPED